MEEEFLINLKKGTEEFKFNGLIKNLLPQLIETLVRQ